MITKDEIQEIFHTLKKNKARTLLTAFGVFWGIFMLLLLLGSGDGLENGVTNMFRSFDLNSFHMYSRYTKIPYQGVQENRRIRYTDQDIALLKAKFSKHIKYIGARSYTNGPKSVKNKTNEEHYSIYGVDPDVVYLRNVDLAQGRYINDFDNLQSRWVAVIGSVVQEELFKGESAIGKYVQIESGFYKVIGVFESLKEGEQANTENKTIIIPHTTFQKSFNRQNTIDNIALVTTRIKTEEQIIEFLKKRHQVHPKDKAIYAWNTRKEFAKYQGLFKAIRTFMWLIGIGTLVSGVVGVSNIMLISIKERTKEIGIRKAIGANPYAILKMIILESILLTSISGYLGLSAGLVLIEVINLLDLKSDFFLQPEVHLHVVMAALITLIFAGFFAAFFPARKAALIPPIVALKEN